MGFRIDWTEEAQADIRALDRRSAMRVFDGLQRYAITDEGDVKQLQDDHADKLRLRIGDYRVFFRPPARSSAFSRLIKNRKESYR